MPSVCLTTPGALPLTLIVCVDETRSPTPNSNRVFDDTSVPFTGPSLLPLRLPFNFYSSVILSHATPGHTYPRSYYPRSYYPRSYLCQVIPNPDPHPQHPPTLVQTLTLTLALTLTLTQEQAYKLGLLWPDRVLL